MVESLINDLKNPELDNIIKRGHLKIKGNNSEKIIENFEKEISKNINGIQGYGNVKLNIKNGEMNLFYKKAR